MSRGARFDEKCGCKLFIRCSNCCNFGDVKCRQPIAHFIDGYWYPTHMSKYCKRHDKWYWEDKSMERASQARRTYLARGALIEAGFEKE